VDGARDQGRTALINAVENAVLVGKRSQPERNATSPRPWPPCGATSWRSFACIAPFDQVSPRAVDYGELFTFADAATAGELTVTITVVLGRRRNEPQSKNSGRAFARVQAMTRSTLKSSMGRARQAQLTSGTTVLEGYCP
jgi:hypothetical protein